MQLYSAALLKVYATKLHYTLQRFDAIASKATNAKIETIKDLYDKVIDNIRKQGYTSAIGGTLAGASSIAAGMVTNQNLQNVFSTFSKVITPVKDVVNTFTEADKTKASQDVSLYRDHELEKLRRDKEAITSMREKIETSVTKVMDEESRAFRTNG
jgi:hypothetical protein